MPALDLGAASVACVSSFVAAGLVVDGGLLCDIRPLGFTLTGLLGGSLALVADLPSYSSAGGVMGGVVILLQLAPVAIACRAGLVASVLGGTTSLRASVGGSSLLLAGRFTGVPALVAAVVCRSGVLQAYLGALTQLPAVAIACVCVPAASGLSMPIALAASVACSCVVAADHLNCGVALQAHVGRAGWERPQLACAIACRCSCVAGDLYVSGPVTVALSL